MGKGMLVDVSKCIACRGCQIACKQWWKLPAVATIHRGIHENPPELTAHTWNRIRFKELEDNGRRRWLFTRKACNHCSEAVCVWVCPSFARGHNDQGFVSIDQERCIGCGRCGEFCPFGVPKLGAHNISKRISVQLSTPRLVSYSCAFCKDRLEQGGIPSCAKSCPTEAIRFGELPDLVKWGQARVTTLKASHPKTNLYGRKEMGGMKVLYVLTEEPEVHGFPKDPQKGAYPAFAKHNFPRWYSMAVSEGKLSAFPPKANSKWYMQPDLIPTPPPKEPEFVALSAGSRFGQWAPVLYGWFGLGVIGALSSVLWSVRRRQTLYKEDQQNKKT